MKKTFFLILIFCSSIIIKTFAQDNENVQGIWNGTVSFFEKYVGMLGHSERTITLNIKNNKVSGSHIYNAETIIEGKKLGSNHCDGVGDGELMGIGINTYDGTYGFSINTPECKSNDPEHGNAGSSGTSIGISNQKLQMKAGKLDMNELTGNETHVADMGGDLGKTTFSTTWHLVRDLDVELIVTPIGFDKDNVQKSYDEWLPEPGKDETTKGSKMKIELKLQSKSGKPLKFIAQSFELKLSNTSREPGITINYPLNPAPKQLPDLRFIPLAVAESDDEDQYITVTCKNGTTGEAYIASYDGGGWATLTVQATLKGNITIEGNLLVSGGETNIEIPKRNAGLKIADDWVQINNVTTESGDKEKSKDNFNDGDGLSVYEEYRGVISEGKYKRLDPNKKEVGILATQTDFSLFKQGIDWFKNASGLEIIRFDFDKEEIGPDGKLNPNAITSHTFDQYAIYLSNGGLGRKGTLGVTYCKADPWIPANITGVIIDYDYVGLAYQKRINEAAPQMPKFTFQEYLAQTVAHELGHAVNIDHHGQDKKIMFSEVTDKDRIFDRNGNLITTRPITLYVIGESTGTVESGNMSCMLNYYPYYSWGHTVDVDGTRIFNQEPLLSLGRIFCTSNAGTGINVTKFYFGAASNGNCIGQIKLKN